jgi:hypothetical protein
VVKIKIIFAIFLLCGGLYYGIGVLSGCPPTWTVFTNSSFSCSNSIARKTWTITWQDGNTSTKDNSATGQPPTFSPKNRAAAAAAVFVNKTAVSATRAATVSAEVQARF